MSSLSPTGALRGIFSLLNFGFMHPKDAPDMADPWAPTPQSLRQLDAQVPQEPQPFVYSPGICKMFLYKTTNLQVPFDPL